MNRARLISPIEKTSIAVFLACFISYTVLSISRNTYSTAIATLTSTGILTKANAGTINASFYLVYGTLQLLGGYLADKFSPFKILLIGLLGSTLSNIFMACTESFLIMLIAWTFNGLAQFGTFPATIKIITNCVLEEHSKKGLAFISYSYIIGSIASYFMAIVILSIWDWHALFISSVILLIAASLLVIYAMILTKHAPIPKSLLPKAVQEVKEEDGNASSVSMWKLLIPSGLLLLTVAAFARCMLDIGLKSWVPTMIIENYPVSINFANTIFIVLLFSNLFGVTIALSFYPKKINNPATFLGVSFLICLPTLFLILLLGKTPVFIIVASLIIITTLMTAVSQITNIALPIAFTKYGKSGTVAGFLNVFSCLGVMLSSYLYGYIADNLGWIADIWVWIIIVAISCVCSFTAIPLWKKFTIKQ